ncbi:MAG: hypothetical protein EZS28_004289 [Streblomastix strix]|uniref:Uncharacterized protein n=1 Tax=Streblomastix strix TaxID=222440 RepID=A0A5J4X137_9EUKA|nr:MAG: hypothetical protein EZS28_004289 [Streblomastix strix]
MGMEPNQRNSQNKTEDAITSPARFILYEKMNKDRNRDKSKTNSQINQKAKLLQTLILRSFTLPEYNRPLESIISKTQWMKYNDNIEQNSNSRHKLVDSETQSEYPSTTNIDTITNDNDNGCCTQ